MNQPTADSDETAPAWALVSFELALGVLGLIVAGVAGFWKPMRVSTWGMPYSTESLSDFAAAVALGLVATLPLFALVMVLRRLPWPALREFDVWIDEHLAPLFANRSRAQIMAIALAAGWGEETLFRWTIQTGFSERFPGLPGLLLGLAAASIAFGLMHAVTRLYAVFATLISVYFGLILIGTESLLTVVIAHAFYDWVIVEQLRHRANRRQQGSDQA